MNADPPLARWTLPVVLAGSFIGILDFFIVNVAIPSIRADLGASSGQIQFVVAGYALGYAVFMITSGRLGDFYGHRLVYGVGLVAFTATSLGCGVAPSAWLLAVFRVAQGISAALLTPQVLSILNINFTGQARAKAFAAFGSTLGLAAVSGQLVGGLLIAWNVADLGWRLCFLINVPIGIAALAMLRKTVPRSHSATTRRLDIGGVVLATVSLGALVVSLVLGREYGWPVWIWLCLAASVPGLLGFAASQRRRSRKGLQPLVEPALFTDRTFVNGLGLVLAFYASLASFFLVLAIFLQRGESLSPLAAGLLFTPLGAGFVATSSYSGRLGAWLGKQALAAGALLMAASYPLLWSATAGTGVSWAWLVVGLLVNGLGEGMAMTLLVSTVLARVKPEYAGSGSGVLATVQQFASSLGVALIGVVFFGALGTGGDYTGAFHAGLVYTTVLLLAVAALVQTLPSDKQVPGSDAPTPAESRAVEQQT